MIKIESRRDTRPDTVVAEGRSERYALITSTPPGADQTNPNRELALIARLQGLTRLSTLSLRDFRYGLQHALPISTEL